MRILIVTPSDDRVHAGYCMSLAALLFNCFRSGMETHYYNPRSSKLAHSRSLGVQKAIDIEASHILWLDSDIEFPPNALLRLLGHDKPIVGASVCARRGVIAAVHAEWTLPDESRVARVLHLPSACLLVKTDVYGDLDKPYYRFPVFDGLEIGEDVDFCRRAILSGSSVWLDRDLSNEITHLGEGRFTLKL